MFAKVLTQNIDGLEAAAGVSAARLVACHGSLATATCLACRRSMPTTDPAPAAEPTAEPAPAGVPTAGVEAEAAAEAAVTAAEVAAGAAVDSAAGAAAVAAVAPLARPRRSRAVRPLSCSNFSTTSSSSSSSSSAPVSFLAAVAAGAVATCGLPRAPKGSKNGGLQGSAGAGDGLRCGGVLKPDVTFFGEALPLHVKRAIEADRAHADLLLVIGTSLQVRRGNAL